MSFGIDLSEYGSELKKQYDNVISSDPSTTWTVFGYDSASPTALKPLASGDGDLDEFIEAFDDASIQYGLTQVEFNGVFKIVLVGYVGENVSGRQRLVFNSHMATVAKQFSGHHIQYTARSLDELTPEIIVERINAAAGSKYTAATSKAQSTKPKYVQAQDGANEDDWGDAKPVEERDLVGGSKSSYTSNTRSELQQFRSKGASSAKDTGKTSSKGQIEPTNDTSDEDDSAEGISGLNSGTSYKPVGKIDIKAIRAEAKNSKFADSRIEKIEPSYKPVGKVDLKAIREQARKEKQLAASKSAQAEDASSLTKDKPKKDSPKEESNAEPVSKTSRQKVAPLLQRDDDSESDGYVKVDRRAEYGVKASQNKTAQKATFSANDEDEDENQFTSLADRMKAFQNSVSDAKPKFDPKSSSRSVSASTTSSSTSKFRNQPSVSSAKESESDDEDEDEDTAPVSVAAQLAKARLNNSTASPEPPKSKDVKEPSSNAAVSSFASRFAKKSENKSSSEPEDTSEDKPGPPASNPVSLPRLPGRHAPEAKREPESESDSEPEHEHEPAQKSESKQGETKHASEKSSLSATVIEEYTKDADDEISLKLKETIVNIEQVDENWWIGENSKGETGLFPADYVQLSGSPASNESARSDAEASESAKAQVATALYSHEPGPDDEDELAFEENEEITDIDFTSDDWWTGRNSKGEVGLFPSNYVKLN